MTTSRLFRISPPMDGSKFTHQTSPRFIADIVEGSFRPFQGLGFARFVLGHLLISGFEVMIKHVWADQLLDKAADGTAAYNFIQPRVHVLVKRDGQLFLHRGI